MSFRVEMCNLIFISYSHEDKRYLKELRQSLFPTFVDQSLRIWADPEIPVAAEWREEIQGALSSAKVAVLLVSRPFLASEFVCTVEIPTILQAAKERGLKILWIPVGDSQVKRTPIFAFQGLHDPGRPLNKLKRGDRDSAWVSIASNIIAAWNGELVVQPPDRPRHQRTANNSRTPDLTGQREQTDLLTVLVRRNSWKTSCLSLAQILDIERYEETGSGIKIDKSRSSKRYIFTEELFVPPAVTSDIRSFLDSERRGFVLIGSPGMGKSSVMCGSFLERIQAGGLAVFVSAWRLQQPSIEEFILHAIAKWLPANSNVGSLDDYLAAQHLTLTLYIDAVNEYNHEGGPVALLNSILDLVEHPSVIQKMKVVASCRAETWSLLCEQRGEHPLKRRHFYVSGDSDAFDIEDFRSNKPETSLKRGRLAALFEKLRDYPEVFRRKIPMGHMAARYEKLREYYDLNPADFPKDYNDLRSDIKEMIGQPFILTMLAETYRPDNEQIIGGRIPKDLRYSILFQDFTERKLKDAASHLYPVNRPAFIHQMRQCLRSFAGLEFCRVVGANFAPFIISYLERFGTTEGYEMRASRTGTLTVDCTKLLYKRYREALAALAGVGLLNLVSTSVRDQSEQAPKDGKAYRFFHDHYTQYWLGKILCEEGFLGPIPSSAGQESEQIERLRHGIEELADLAASAPVVAGAIDHWFYLNMMEADEPGKINVLLPLLNCLAASQRPRVLSYVREFIAGTLGKSLVSPNPFFQRVFEDGTPYLHLEVAEMFREYWPHLKASDLAAFVENADEKKHDLALERLAEIFTHHFGLHHQEVLEYHDAAFYSLGGLWELWKARSQSEAVKKQVAYLARFCVGAALSRMSDLQQMDALRQFLTGKYASLVNALTGGPWYRIAALGETRLRNLLYPTLEQIGIYQWGRTIGGHERGGNDDFFVQDKDGIVQRDVLYDSLCFAVDIHNEAADPSEYLHPNSEFWQKAVYMLKYRPASAIGYVAACLVALLLRREPRMTENVVDELIRCAKLEPSTSSGLSYFTTFILLNLAIIEKSQAESMLKIMKTRIVPWLLSQPENKDSDIIAVLGIASVDMESHWGECAALLSGLLQNLSRESKERISSFCDELLNCCFYPDAQLGANVVSLMIQQGYAVQPKWEDGCKRVMAGLCARDPGLLRKTLGKFQDPPFQAEVVVGYVNDKLTAQRDKFHYRSSWNQFIAAAFGSSKPLRYYLFKILLGGLVQSNSVPDYGREFRRFVVETTREFLVKPRGSYVLTVEGIRAETESKRKLGGGLPWDPEKSML